MRQVTHALLTRPPLSCFKSIRKLHQSSSVRLACVRHAASVHPEPGSNSHVKVVWFLHQLNWLIRRKSSICAFYFLKVLFSEQSYRFISETFSIEFSGLHYCLFVKVLHVLVWHNSITLSYVLKFVKNFLKYFYFSQPLLPQWIFILTCFFISVNMFFLFIFM